jgi:hypothetical protein
MTPYLGHFWNYKIFEIEGNSVAVSNIIISVIIFFIGLFYLKKFNNFLAGFLQKKLKNNKDAANLLENIAFYSLSFFLALIALQVAHVPLKSLAFIGGALAIGVGLGTKNLINNFISSIIILVERPIKIGDYIEIGNVKGYVEAIGARCIRLRQINLTEVIIPNSKVIEDNLFNYTLSDSTTKLFLKINFYKNQLSMISKSSGCSISFDALDKDIFKNKNNTPPEALMNKISEEIALSSREFISDTLRIYLTSADEFCLSFTASLDYDRSIASDSTKLKSDIMLALIEKFGAENITIEFI